jgi:peptidase M28-like protein
VSVRLTAITAASAVLIAGGILTRPGAYMFAAGRQAIGEAARIGSATKQTPPAPVPKTSAPARGQEAARGQQPATFDSSRAYEHLRQMVSFGPRPSGSAAIRQTRAYITRQLSSYGLTVLEQPFTAATPLGNVDMINLSVRVPGRRTDRILLTGHYDTKLYRDRTFVGASDAASSAAILIELARVLKTRSREFTYEFVWFDGEEAVCEGWDQCGTPRSPDNTYGSRYYVQAAKKANVLPQLRAMILFDMIGARNLKLRRDNASTAWLTDLIWATAKRLGHNDVFLDSSTEIGGDDHMPFIEAGVPAVDLIDLMDYPEWHTPQDDLAHVAAGSLQVVGDVTVAALPEIEKKLLR